MGRPEGGRNKEWSKEEESSIENYKLLKEK